jgi:prepilin-type processing-associated H-X9-DG protein
MTRSRVCGFTLIEMLVIIVTVLLVLFVFIPAVRRAGPDRACSNNLKIIGLSFRTWALDSTDWFPTEAPVASGGAKERAEKGEAFFAFVVMSNELSTPNVLVCPSDKRRLAATSFSKLNSNTNISYFVGLDAKDILPQTLLSGDRSLAFGGKPLKPGIFSVTTNTVLTWTKELHRSCGNVLFADGSVQRTDHKGLADAIRNQDVGTNRVVLP